MLLSSFGQPDSISALLVSSGGVPAMRPKGVTPEPSPTEFEKHTHLQINLVFTEDSIGSLVYVLQLNVPHTGRLMIQLARYSRYRSTFS
ncbi:hypothetical protein T265_00482 [Opisthorchis viverrini]|uniref:Uncharacterized protein n=1 Tax=Opisthorchis viverrini TaxID=6198 RepID=A0A075A1H6_OPIVI|nr:hypothetical protein T265_00482 [Opisthorchis viverrini]KER33583.1 hypothetical protein T265_00482 [Opisthorchis viverrini]